MGMTAEQCLIRARIKLYDEQPFFSYVINHMQLIEKPKEFFTAHREKAEPTMAVDAKGNCYYYKEFVLKLPEQELKAVLAHEAMHCVLMHLNRFEKGVMNENKDIEIYSKMNIWNIATDLLINNMLLNNQFELPKGCIIPTTNNTYVANKKVIKDIDKKIAETIYNELFEVADKIKGNSWDIHIYSKEKSDGQGMGKDGKDDNGNKEGQGEGEKDWKQVLTDAAYFAKSRGKLKGDLERLVDKMLNKKLNWAQMLYRFITNEIQHDFTYARPSRKFISTGIYFPNTNKENIKITAAIDTSGSIGNKELALFLGEIYKITSAHNNIELEVMFHDTEISSKSKFNHSNLHKVKSLKPTGGGGTSHKEVFEYAAKNKPNILVCFTDGMSDINDCKRFNNTLFVLTSEDFKPAFGQSVVFDREALK